MSIYQHGSLGTLNARLVLYNRRHPHNKVYIITMYVDFNRRYYVTSYYGRIETWNQYQPDFLALTHGPVKQCHNATEAINEFNRLATRKVEEKGYTTNSDGVTYINRFALPNVTNLITEMGHERDAADTPVTASQRPVAISTKMHDIQHIDGVRMVTTHALTQCIKLLSEDGRELVISHTDMLDSSWPDLFSRIRDWVNEPKFVQPVAKPVSTVGHKRGRLIEW